MIKDHLGNVRMVLTDDIQTDHYPTATLETNALTAEQNYYDIGNHVVATPSNVPTYTNDNGTNNPNSFGTPNANSAKMYQLGGTGNKTSLSMVLKVMAGDKLDILGKSWYEYTGGTVTNSSLAAGDLISAFLGSGGSL